MDDCIVLDPQSGFFPRALSVIARKQRIPYKGQFELTARCNFNCRMCYIHMSDSRIKELGHELTTDEWLRIAEEAKEQGMLFLTLTGGEVFTRPDFRELYEKLSEMGFLIQIMTNASLIDEKVMSWLSKKPPYIIRITLYGSNNDVYESVCRIKNGFDRVDRAIDLLQNANIPISLKSTLIRNNEDDIYNMHRYAAGKNLRLDSTYGIVKSVRGAVSDAEYVRRLQDGPLPDALPQIQKLKTQDGHGPYRHHPNYLDDCGSYGSTMYATWDGKLVLCGFMAEPFCDLRSMSVKEAWTSLLEKSASVKKPEECNSCKYEEYCMRCPGSLAGESGSYLKVSPEYCNQAKYLYSLYEHEEGGV